MAKWSFVDFRMLAFIQILYFLSLPVNPFAYAQYTHACDNEITAKEIYNQFG